MSRLGVRAAVLLAAVVVSMGGSPALAQSAPDLKWGPHIDLEAKPGTKRSLGEGDAFLPLLQNADTLLFANLRMRFDDSDGNEGNYGLGVRHMLDSGWNIGGYGYFDRRRTEYGNYFNQTTFGVEALSTDWDARANYYAPVGRRSHQIDALSTAEVSGSSVIFRGGEERSLGGFDAELGWRLPIFDATADRQVRVYGGGYRFRDEGVPDIEGPRFRAEMTFDSVPGLWDGSRFSIGAEWQHDEPRGSQGFLTARLRIPLQVYGKPSSQLTPMERRMADPVMRDIDVVSQAGAFGAAEAATRLANGSSFTLVNSASTSGANLQTALNTAGSNSTVVLYGTFNTGASQTTLQSGQTVIGAGSVSVRSPSGRVASLAASTSTISSSVGGGSVRMGNGSTLEGMTIVEGVGSGSSAIGVIAASNSTIRNNTISASGSGTSFARAVVVSEVSNVTIAGNTISAQADAGAAATALYVATTATSASFRASGNTLSATGGGTNHHTRLNSGGPPIQVLSGSTGNIIQAGTCLGSATGSVSYTNGTTCP